ncbi:MAG: hypothetical protein PWP27_187 [Clostridiales bacterium]|nr:hypothetical protein [Clostridiales bacterium]
MWKTLQEKLEIDTLYAIQKENQDMKTAFEIVKQQIFDIEIENAEQDYIVD